jgi:hypothetical protein
MLRSAIDYEGVGMPLYEWSQLNRQQVGRYAEYLFKMQFVMLGFDVYGAEVDDRGIDFVLRQDNPTKYWDVQVKSVRRGGYVFIPKSKFRMTSNYLVALAIFQNGSQPDLFLIPATRWRTPDGTFVDRNYEGLKSAPEYGLNLSTKAGQALQAFRFDNGLESIFGTHVADLNN